MKKSIFTFFIIALIGLACNEEKIVPTTININEYLSNIESDITNSNINFNTINLITNVEAIKQIERYKKSGKDALKSNIASTTNRDSVLRLRVENMPNLEKTLFESYFKSLRNSNLSSIAITEHYISEVNKIPIELSIKNEFISSLINYKDILIYLKVDENEIGVNYNRLKTPTWNCFDKCMYKKGQEFENANWIDQAGAILGMPETFVYWSASCTWDCW